MGERVLIKIKMATFDKDGKFTSPLGVFKNIDLTIDNSGGKPVYTLSEDLVYNNQGFLMADDKRNILTLFGMIIGTDFLYKPVDCNKLEEFVKTTTRLKKDEEISLSKSLTYALQSKTRLASLKSKLAVALYDKRGLEKYEQIDPQTTPWEKYTFINEPEEVLKAFLILNPVKKADTKKINQSRTSSQL